MAKTKEAYFWCGKGGLKIDRLYTTGEKIPHEKMGEETFKNLIESGEIKSSPFEIVEDSTVVSDLERKVKELTAELAKKNKKAECKKCPELENENSELKAKVEEAEKMLESITATGDEKKDA